MNHALLIIIILLFCIFALMGLAALIMYKTGKADIEQRRLETLHRKFEDKKEQVNGK